MIKLFCILALLIVSIMPQIISNKSLGTVASSLHGGNDKSSVAGVSLFMEEEIWRDIPGYKKQYQASTFGRIKRLNTKAKHWRGGFCDLPEKLMILFIDNRYQYVNLTSNGKQKKWRVNRLIAIVFIPNPEKKPEVNHLDGDKLNNHVTNLEWATRLENEQHKLKNIKIKWDFTGLKNFEKGWLRPHCVNGLKIRSADNKKSFKLLLSGVSTNQIIERKISKRAFWKFMQKLKKHGIIICVEMIGASRYKIVKYKIDKNSIINESGN